MLCEGERGKAQCFQGHGLELSRSMMRCQGTWTFAFTATWVLKNVWFFCVFLFLDGKNKVCTTSPEAHAMLYFPMIDTQFRGLRWVYRLLPPGCFLAGRPVVDVAAVHVTLSVSGPLRFQRESSRRSSWTFGAREEILFALRVVLKMLFASSPCPPCRPSAVSKLLLSKQLVLNLQIKQSWMLVRRRGFAEVFGGRVFFICSRVQCGLIVHSPSCLTGLISGFCHLRIASRTKDASVRPTLIASNARVLVIQILLWSLWLERNYFGDFWVRVPGFIAILGSQRARGYFFQSLTAARIALNIALVAFRETIHSPTPRSFKVLRPLSVDVALTLTVLRIAADGFTPPFVMWRSISIFLNGILGEYRITIPICC